MKSWFVVILLACGCGAATQASGETLAESIRAYNEGVRWQRYANAASRVPLKERTKFVEDMDKRSEDMRITDYEVVTVDSHGTREAKVHVKLSWYLDADQVLRTTHAMQTWERHGKAWLMVDEAKLRGHDMPGLADRGAEPNPL